MTGLLIFGFIGMICAWIIIWALMFKVNDLEKRLQIVEKICGKRE